MSMLRNANLIAPYGTETEIEDRTPPHAQPQRGRLDTRAAPSRKRNRSSSTSSSRISYSSSSSEEDHTRQHRRRHGAHAHKDHRSTNKRRNRGVKRRTSRREHTRRHRDRRSSGESMSSDTTINSDKELDLPPVSYGGKVGDSVCKTIVKNIKKGKYINFGDLLPDRSEYDTKSDIFVKIGDKGTHQFEKRGKTRILTFTEWSEAFDIFMMINIDIQCSKNKDTKSLLKDMLTYRKHVMSMMKDGGDWREYDKHFRKLMEVQPVSWSTANFNLIWHYNIRNNMPKNTTTSTVTTNATSANNSESQKKPCYMFNTPNVRCPRTSITCRFQHQCMSCGSIYHPEYMCNTRTKTNGRAAVVGQVPYFRARASGSEHTYTGHKKGVASGPQTSGMKAIKNN